MADALEVSTIGGADLLLRLSEIVLITETKNGYIVIMREGQTPTIDPASYVKVRAALVG